MTTSTIVRPAGGRPPRDPGRPRSASIAAAAPIAGTAVALLLAEVLSGCGDGWVKSHPDVAGRARAVPRPFVDEAAAAWRGVDGLAGSYRLTVRRRVGRRGYDLWIAVRRPDRIRIEALRPTGATEALLVAGSAGVGLWLAEEGRLYRSADPAAFDTALGLPLGAREAVGILLGYGVDPAPPDGEGASPDVAWDEERQRIRVAGPGSIRWLHPVTLHYDRMVFEGAGSPVEVTLSGRESPVPESIRIGIPAESLELRLERGTWNPEPRFDDATFRVPRLPGVEVVPLERLEIDGGLFRRDDGR